MTDHRRWLALAAAAPTFSSAADETDAVRRHLTGCAACAAEVAAYRRDAAAIAAFDPGPLPDRLRHRIQEAAMTTTARTRPTPLVALVVLGLLALGAIGASIGAGGLFRGGILADPFDRTTRYDWQTDAVRLVADELRIEAAGRMFVVDPGTLSVTGDPGTATGWTLEAAWQEHGTQQRLYLYFAADEASWWVTEVRVYDGVAQPSVEWASFPPGPYLRTPVGRDWVGDLELIGSGRAGEVRLVLRGAAIRVSPADGFAAPPNGGRPLPVNSDPFEAGGPLHCSGILEMTPDEAHDRLIQLGYRVSWREVTDEEWIPRTEPPDGVILRMFGGPVGTDGQLIIAVVPADSPEAAAQADEQARPSDCPAPAPPLDGPTPVPSAAPG